MDSKLTKSQARGLGDAIFDNIKGEESFKNPYDVETKIKLYQVVDNLWDYNYSDKDLDIAEIFQYLPYTHEENESKLAIQLLAWHKISYDNDYDQMSYAEKRKILFELLESY